MMSYWDDSEQNLLPHFRDVHNAQVPKGKAALHTAQRHFQACRHDSILTMHLQTASCVMVVSILKL